MLKAIRVAATVLATVLVAEDVVAESGTYESIISIATNYTTIEYADQTITGGPSHGTQTIVESSGGLFAKGASSAVDCIVFAKKSAAGMDLEAPCAITDSSGDKNFLVYRRKVGEVTAGGGGQGMIELVGGTGRYASLTGRCTYSVSYMPGNRGVTTQKCQWQKP